MATDGLIFRSVRRIEPDIFILVLPPSAPLPDDVSRGSGGALVRNSQCLFLQSTNVGHNHLHLVRRQALDRGGVFRLLGDVLGELVIGRFL